MVKGGFLGSVCGEGAGEVSHLQAADCAALMTLDAQLLEEKTRINRWGVCNADFYDYLLKVQLVSLPPRCCWNDPACHLGVLITKSTVCCIHVDERPLGVGLYVSPPAVEGSLISAVICF